VQQNSNNILRDSAFLAHVGNQHFWVDGGSSGGTTGTIYEYNVADGDNFYQSDGGDVCTSIATGTCKYNVAINASGTIFTAKTGGSAALTMNHNTSYDSFSGSMGEAAGSATMLTSFLNNLIISPYPTGTAEQGGLWQESSFVTQTMGAGTLDYNGFYGTMYSSNLTNAALSGIVSYVGPATYSAWFTSATYGTTSGYGTHDIHADPQFVDSTRTLCKFYTSNGGYANCAETAANTATTSTSTTLIYCTTCNFTSWNIGTNDWVADYASAGDSPRGVAQVTTVNSATEITVSPAITGMTSGDHFTFITDTRGLGRAIVTLNGWDYTGASTTPVSWATTIGALNYIRAGFAFQNSTYHNAGSDGLDIGAVAYEAPASSTNAFWMFNTP
jgi:hypothetical protein